MVAAIDVGRGRPPFDLGAEGLDLGFEGREQGFELLDLALGGL